MSLEDFAKGAGRATASAYDDAAVKWGAWRRFLSRRPLTGMWIAVAVAIGPAWLIGRSGWPL